MASDERLRIILEATDNASAAVRGFSANVQETVARLESMSRGVDIGTPIAKSAETGMTGATAAINKGAPAAAQAASNAGKSAGQGFTQQFEYAVQSGDLQQIVAAGLGLGTLGMVAKQSIETQFALAQLGTQSDRIAVSFRNLAGSGADTMLMRLRSAVSGTVTDMDLMLNANRMMMMGVTDDADTMARLMEVAISKGRAMGISTSFALESMAIGLARVSPRWLDNMGIIIDAEAAYAQYASTVGKAADDLTPFEQRQALVNEILKDTSVVSRDAAGHIESLGAAWQDLKILAGKAIALPITPVGAAITVGGAELGAAVGAAKGAESFNEFTKALIANADSLSTSERLWAEATGLLISFNLGANATAKGADAMRQSYVRLNDALVDHATAMNDSYDAGGLLAEALEQLSELGQDNATVMWSQLTPATYTYAASLGELAFQTINAINAQAELQGQLRQTMHTESELQAMAMTGSGIITLATGTMGVGRPSNRTVMNEAEAIVAENAADRLAKAEREAASAAKDYQRELEQQASEMQSFVEEMLQPTSVTERDMLETQFNEYNDKWDEYVRKLRSAATDAKSAWKDMIPADILAQGADAVKLWEMKQEEAFYAGQLPEAIDWDAFTRQANEELARRASKEALIQEGVRRLGGTMTSTDVAKLLGVETTTVESGASMVEAFGQGATSVDLGGQVTTTFQTQITAQYKVWRKTGEEAVSEFLAGGLEAVTPEYGQKLLSTMLPFMAEWLSKNGVALGGNKP